MNRVNLFLSILLLFVFHIPGKAFSQSKHQTEWVLSQLISSKTEGIRITGHPRIIDCKYGKALVFNGSTDGIFLEEMPLSDLKEFTIEVLFYPESGGNFEQRFFHCGEVKGDRVLLELRSTQTDWYFDAYIKSGDQQKTLIEPELKHPLDQWYHIACAVDHRKLSTYINGKKELESSISFEAIKKGETSIGTRLNEQSWFKGAISQIRISPKALKATDFMTF